MFLQNFWSDWIELDLINCVTTIYIWISRPFFDVSRRDLAIKEKRDCLENFVVNGNFN